MGASEFDAWMVYNDLAPVDHTRRIELMLAQFMAAFHNANRGKNGRKFKADEFLPDYEGLAARSRRQQTQQQQLWAMRQMFAGLGGEPDDDFWSNLT
jgi:hypothetical protein